MKANSDILEMAREEATDCLERLERNLLALEGGSAGPDAIDAMFRDAHSIKGTASMVGWKEVSSIADAMESRLEECRSQGAFPPELVDPLLRATDALRRAIAGDTDHGAPVIEELDAEAPTAPALPPPELSEIKPATPAPATPPSRPGTDRAIRVSAEKVDRMLDAVGESVLHHRRLEHQLRNRIMIEGDDVAEEELDMSERLLDELQDSVIEMRTLPLSSITTPYPRAVRDIAAAEGKQVELVISGAETQLDRVILEGISETITHLLRNAVAHGVETPDERERAGKPRAARLVLRAEQRGSMVAIELEDDGRGVSPELLARAKAEGSLTEVLAQPGFSTATAVSELAGRGVGLDAVKSHVERLGGSLEVLSEPSRGTKVVLLLPLTLALLRVLLCERAGQPFGLPLASVREVVAVGDTTSLGGRRSLELRGETIPLGDLAAIMGASAPPLEPFSPAMILVSPARVVGITCDRVLGDQELVTKRLGPLLAGVPGYLGAAILGDGRVALILDPSHLLSRHASGSAPSTRITAPEKRSAPNVLVVDDQFTVRELQRSILETAGYRVQTARDGREALERIVGDPDLDMVLTDIQMPEMDGLELLAAIRQHPEHASLPVVIVTSQGGEADRRLGAEKGADAYIVKDEFDQQALLETIDRLVGR
ncbi:MAG: response regulator [Actinomycetota bacterium]|nr:response regulator [Actinomycetota bacterium]